MLAPWKKSYDQPRQHIKKQRHYFANKGPSSQGYGFSSGHVRVWELDYKESWVPKNWCFWTMVLEKTLESPLDCKEIQPVHPRGISPEYSLEGLMLKLKLQYFGHLMRRTYSLEKPWCWETLKAGGEGDDRGWNGWMASANQCTWVWASSGSWWWTGKPGVLQPMGLQRIWHNWVTELNWEFTKWHILEGASGKQEKGQNLKRYSRITPTFPSQEAAADIWETVTTKAERLSIMNPSETRQVTVLKLHV